MKNISRAVYLAGLLLLTMTGIAHASSIDVGFYRISSNSPTNIASQLHLSILDEASADSLYHIDINSNQVLFIFTNAVGITSNVSEIYIDDSDILALTFGSIHDSISGTTDFVPGATPSNLPGGVNLDPDFLADTNLSVEAENGQQKWGVDASNDILGIVYDVSPSTSIMSGIANALASGDLRIGLHVRSVDGGTSDAYVNGSPVPEPATLLLFGTGIVGLAGAARMKRKS